MRLPRQRAPFPERAAKAVRPLGCVERFFHLYALTFPVHFCLAAEILGAVDVPKLRTALEQVRRRHPALRVSIGDDAGKGPMFETTDNPIELRASVVEAGSDWRGAVESELNRSFDPSPGPLMRVTALLKPGGASVVLTFHHAVADAISGVHVIDDLMRALAGDPLAALPSCPPLEAVRARPASRAAVALGDAPPADTASPAAPVAAAAESLPAKVTVLAWDQDETDRLLHGCRANRTTVHAAICAATSRHLPVSDGETLRLHSPMDLRRLAEVETGHCGVFIGASVVEIPAASRRSLWDDARDVAGRLRMERSWPAVSGMLQQVADAFPPTADPDRVAEFFASQPQSSAVVSNLGVLPLASDRGPFRLEAVWGPVMLTNPPADRQTIGVSTFAGRLRMAHQSYRPVSGLLDAIRDDLLGFCP